MLIRYEHLTHLISLNIDNICVRENNQRSCRRNGDCRNGQRCNQSGWCVRDKSRKPRSGKRCNYNSSTRNRREQCPGNQICGRNNRCQRRNMDFEEAMVI